MVSVYTCTPLTVSEDMVEGRSKIKRHAYMNASLKNGKEKIQKWVFETNRIFLLFRETKPEMLSILSSCVRELLYGLIFWILLYGGNTLERGGERIKQAWTLFSL